MMKMVSLVVVLLFTSACSIKKSAKQNLESMTDRTWLLESWSYADGGNQPVLRSGVQTLLRKF